MRVIEYGEKMQEMNTEKIKNAGIETAFADGTKTHSQEKEMKNAMTEDVNFYQLDLVHAARIAGFKLWEDKIMMSENLMFIMAEVKICSIRGQF